MASSTLSKRYMIKRLTGSSTTISGNNAGGSTISISEQGYTPIGIVGHTVTTSGSFPLLIEFVIKADKTGASLFYRNVSSSAITFTPKIDVLFERS